MSSAPYTEQPIFNVPVRWVLRVLAWLGFGVTAYLAWKSVTQTSVAGCGVGGHNGCDVVLDSAWSKWLGVPVAVPGLACYATLAGLSVLLGMRNPRAARWINTAFVLLAALAAGASLWFIAIQVFAIGDFCPFCIVADLSGIAIGALAIGSVIRWLQSTRYLRRARTPHAGLMSLRSALPTPGRTVPISQPVVASRQWPTPSLPIALGAAGALLVLLVGGQILFPAKTYELQQIALEDSIEMNGSRSGEGTAGPAQSTGGETRIAMRPEISDERPDAAPPAEPVENATGEGEPSAEPANGERTASNGDSSPPEETTPSAAPSRERLVKFLGGKLTLDVYKHPLIGSPDAPHVMVEMVSYDCLHCRKMHRMMKKALARYGNQVAIIVMVIPLEKDCNKLFTSSAGSHPGACSTARMAVGLAKLKPSAFSRFHDWLMADDEKPPPRDQIIARAYSMVDRSRLRELSQGDELKKQIAQYVDLFGRLQKQNAGNKEFGLPVQILGDHVLTGSLEKADQLYGAWEEHLGVKPR